MNIYEIDLAIVGLIDEETGEICDFEKFEALQMAREQKIENTALFVKNLEAEAKAIREEEKSLAERCASAENKAKRLREYLGLALCGEKFATPRVALTWRKSQAVCVDDGFIEWAKEHGDEYLKFKEPEISKSAIKDAIKDGKEFEFARIVENSNLQIK